MIADWIGAGAAVASAAAAFAAWRAARESNKVAARVASIEEARRLAELSPTLEVEFQKHAGSSSGVVLAITLASPVDLVVLDELWVELRPDTSRMTRHAGSLTQEEVDAEVWGPVQFVEHIDGSPSRKRSTTFKAIEQASPLIISVERSRRPQWVADDEQWRAQWSKQPARIKIHCRAGDDAWVLNRNVDSKLLYPPRAVF
jgi:hypothetical protein